MNLSVIFNDMTASFQRRIPLKKFHHKLYSKKISIFEFDEKITNVSFSQFYLLKNELYLSAFSNL